MGKYRRPETEIREQRVGVLFSEDATSNAADPARIAGWVRLHPHSGHNIALSIDV